MESLIEETLNSLEMPRAGLERWFLDLERFCSRHGGERHYGELLALIEECREALARRGGGP